MEEQRPEYDPLTLSVENKDFEIGKGTTIVLSQLKRARLRAIDPQSTRRRLARRFSVVGSEGFRVRVNGEEVGPADRDDLKFVEYLWAFGDSSVDTTG